MENQKVSLSDVQKKLRSLTPTPTESASMRMRLRHWVALLDPTTSSKYRKLLTKDSVRWIRFDPENRAGTGANSKTVASIKHCLYTAVMPGMTSCRREDGFFDLLDGHGRSVGLLWHSAKGSLTEEQLDSFVDVRVVHEDNREQFIRILNQNHTASQKLCRRDTDVGAYFFDIIERAGIATGKGNERRARQNGFASSIYFTFARVICCSTPSTVELFTKTGAQAQAIVAQLREGLIGPQSVFTPEDTTKFVTALKYVATVQSALFDCGMKVTDQIAVSKGLISLLLGDYLTGREFTQRSPDSLASSIKYDTEAIASSLNFITRNNAKNFQSEWATLKRALCK